MQLGSRRPLVYDIIPRAFDFFFRAAEPLQVVPGPSALDFDFFRGGEPLQTPTPLP